MSTALPMKTRCTQHSDRIATVALWASGACLAAVLIGAIASFAGERTRLPELALEPTSRVAIASASLEPSGVASSRDAGYVTVTGYVTNGGGAPQRAVEAVVELLGADGTLLGLQAALVEAPRLAPGEVSPFAVTLRDARGASRYRVWFRPIASVEGR